MLKLPVPQIATGKPQVVSAPSTRELKRLVGELAARAEALKKGRVDPREDNMLKITSEGRKAALDLRLLRTSARDYPDSKVNLAFHKIHDIWEQTTEQRSTQLVFCDMSTPKQGKGFSVYDDLKAKLVDAGVPPSEIAFIQDYETAEEEIPRIEQRLAAVQQDITARQDTRGDAFSIEIEGQTHTDRGIAGELINRKAQRVRATGRDERVGHFAGFAVFLAPNSMEKVDLVIKGATTYFANVSDSPLGTIRSLEHTVQSFEQVGNDCAASMQATQKRLKDLNEQICQPFEYADELAEKLKTATGPHRAARLEQKSSRQYA